MSRRPARGDTTMIKLTRLNGDEFVLNAEMIRVVESRPDTYVTLLNGDRFLVRETVEDVVARSLAWSRAVRVARPAA